MMATVDLSLGFLHFRDIGHLGFICCTLVANSVKYFSMLVNGAI